MLVRPDRVDPHKNPTGDVLDRSGNASTAQLHHSPSIVQEPMKFAKHQTTIERVASNILDNKNLDPSPSRRTLFGSDEAVLDLRP